MGTDDFKYQEAIFCYGSLAKYSRGRPFLPNLSQGDVSPPAPPRPPLFCVHRGGQGVSVGPCVVVAVSKQFHVGAGSPLLPYKGKGGRRLSPRCLSTVGPCDCVTATSLAQNDLEGDVIHLSLCKHRHPAWLPWFFPPSFLGGAAEMLPRARCADAGGVPLALARPLARQHFLESLHLLGHREQGPTHSVLASLPGGRAVLNYHLDLRTAWQSEVMAPPTLGD